MIDRRGLLRFGAGLIAGVMAHPGAVARAAVPSADLREAMDDSPLIYLTPMRGDGTESRCQAEVWFAHYRADLYVVTAHDAWRARAIAGGLTRARVWVGDVGVWSDSDGAYRQLPQLETIGSREQDPDVHQAVLDVMGDKYPLQWFVWGRRFRNGLADGSRIMLKYQIVTM